MSENKTSLLYWFPKISELGIPVPKTFCLPVDARKMLDAMEGGELTPEFVDEVRKAGESMGYPLFLRTDLQSGKHGWKNTCYVKDASRLLRNMFGVAEENEMGACMFGEHYEAFVFREFLPLETSFTAFYGDMPINQERRYFIKDGIVFCHHPYWPEAAIEEHTQDEGWKEKLATLNEEPAEEIALLRDYALRVSAALPGFWSVDFAKTKDGKWYLIDMAEGEVSYHWPGCVNEKLQDKRSMLERLTASNPE